MNRNKKNYDKKLIKQQLLSQLPFVLSYLLPEGKHQGQQYVVGNIQGDSGKSLVVELHGEKIGLWHDFATSEGGDIFDLWAYHLQLDTKRDFTQIMQHIAQWLGHDCDFNSNPSQVKPHQQATSKKGVTRQSELKQHQTNLAQVKRPT